ncbi:hypothetical protein E2C01_017353 [Portunus trituberculatus]|uniref:Uncharacterized protein n=1 Tax=Portunus trituberculatus TaxID=210409 RepID=A0A5B7DTE8_PORTR|nr:hypothetical protein [Portunus trituberculatus]
MHHRPAPASLPGRIRLTLNNEFGALHAAISLRVDDPAGPRPLPAPAPPLPKAAVQCAVFTQKCVGSGLDNEVFLTFRQHSVRSEDQQNEEGKYGAGTLRQPEVPASPCTTGYPHHFQERLAMQNSTHMINFVRTQISSSLTSERCARLNSHLEKQSTQLLSEHYLQSRKVITLGDAGSSAASKGSLCILQTSRVTSCRIQTGSELSWFKFPRQILLTAPPIAGPPAHVSSGKARKPSTVNNGTYLQEHECKSAKATQRDVSTLSPLTLFQQPLINDSRLSGVTELDRGA